MAILSVTTDFTGEVGVSPRLVRMLTSDSYETVTAENYLQSAISMGYTFYPNDLVELTYGSNSDTTKIFSLSMSSGSITLVPPQGSVTGNTQIDRIAVFADTHGTLKDSNVYVRSVIISTSSDGQDISLTTGSAAPGNLTNLTGSISNTATTQTSGTLIGLLGEATVPAGKTAGNSAALYGVQGTCVVNGTVNGASASISGIRGTLDLSSATLTQGNYSCISGDAGASGPNTTIPSFNLISVTNNTNTTSNSHIQTIGKATYWANFTDNGSGIITGISGTTATSPAKIKILVNGSPLYLLAASDFS